MDPELLADFLEEARELVETASVDIPALEASPGDGDLLNRLFRAFHTVKGGAGFLGIDVVVTLCHRAEDLMSDIRAGKLSMTPEAVDAVARALSVTERMLQDLSRGETPEAAPPEVFDALDAARRQGGSAAADDISEDEFEALLDSLHGPGGAPGAEADAAEADANAEPQAASSTTVAPAAPAVSPASPAAPAARAEGDRGVAAETSVRVDARRLDRLMDLVGELVLVRNRLKAQPEGLDERARRAVTELDQVTGALQRSVMAVRMQPVSRLFSRIPRMVRELARGLGKEVDVHMDGEGAELDKHMLDALADPLVHLVRNALDHGIELPAARREAGKPARGSLRVSARQAGDHIEILLSDDGAGIDPDAVRRIAVSRGVLNAVAAEALADGEAQALIFAPGFSTRDAVSDISGRGVGMDVVKTRITELGGSVSLHSEPGKGTQLRLRLPLTLAVLPSLMVRVGTRSFALPLAEVRELSQLPLDAVERVGRRWQVPMAQGVLPLIFLQGWCEGRDETTGGLIVQVDTERGVWGLVVDSVIGREDIVVRPLARQLRGLPGYAGATVTGRGDVALVLDPQGVVSTSPFREAA